MKSTKRRRSRRSRSQSFPLSGVKEPLGAGHQASSLLTDNFRDLLNVKNTYTSRSMILTSLPFHTQQKLKESECEEK